MTLRNFIRIIGFVLIIAGTAGLLLSEFAWERSSSRVIIFAIVNIVGLVSLSFSHLGMKKTL